MTIKEIRLGHFGRSWITILRIVLLKVGTIFKFSSKPLSFDMISTEDTEFPSITVFVVILSLPTPITFGGVV